MKTLVLATRNLGKAREFQDLLGPLGWKVITASQAGYDGEPDETGKTFRENARIKAEEVSRHVTHPVLADDSGLEVEALGGEPGIHSARYAGPGATDAENRAKLLESMAGQSNRRARFVCVLCLMRPEADALFFEGDCPGAILRQERGDGGFGYDPLFVPYGETRTFAEMTPEEKNPVSHRGRATARLREFLGPA
jgi:XTP/dITP diphosphohydrolase